MKEEGNGVAKVGWREGKRKQSRMCYKGDLGRAALEEEVS